MKNHTDPSSLLISQGGIGDVAKSGQMLWSLRTPCQSQDPELSGLPSPRAHLSTCPSGRAAPLCCEGTSFRSQRGGPGSRVAHHLLRAQSLRQRWTLGRLYPTEQGQELSVKTRAGILLWPQGEGAREDKRADSLGCFPSITFTGAWARCVASQPSPHPTAPQP